MPRLLRLGRILKFMENMKGANLWRILRLFIVYFFFAHWFGCFWYYIANYAHTDNIESDFNKKYAMALYYGLLIISGEPINPKEKDEMLFVIVCFMLG
jgi:hypothetical protein